MSEHTRSGTTLGTSIGRYRISRHIGSGALGRVFECRDTDENRVAVKVLRSNRRAVGARLLRDRLVVQQIHSPHVVQIFDVATFHNTPYIVMEFVEGESLAALLHKGRLRTVDALTLARTVALGLQAAWVHGVAHGDLRPANILIPPAGVEEAKLCDFTLAPPVEGTESLHGTPAYMAPELLVDAPADALTDLYALGCLLFEVLTGKPPFSGAPAAVLQGQLSSTPPSLAAVMPGCPQGLVDLVDRLLDKDRARRMKTHAECVAAVDRALQGLSLPPPPKPQLPELELDVGDDLFDDEGTDEFHTSLPSEVPSRAEPDDDSEPLDFKPAVFDDELDSFDVYSDVFGSNDLHDPPDVGPAVPPRESSSIATAPTQVRGLNSLPPSPPVVTPTPSATPGPPSGPPSGSPSKAPAPAPVPRAAPPAPAKDIASIWATPAEAAPPARSVPDLEEHTRIQPGIAAKSQVNDPLGALLDDLIPTKKKP